MTSAPSVLRKLATAGFLVAASVFLLSGGYAVAEILSGNFHTVVAGEFYRSGQLDDQELASYVKRFRIKTIINLRGANEGKPWYRSELATAKQLGVDHVDFDMYSRRPLTQGEAAALLDVYRNARKPILVHCDSGADRSSLAAALYVAGVAKLGEDAAEGQMSILFGFLGVLANRSLTMGNSWESLEPWLGFTDS